jgi:hypothetical protein
MSSHVGPIATGGFPQEKEAILVEVGGQHTSSTVETNFSLKQGKPQYM